MALQIHCFKFLHFILIYSLLLSSIKHFELFSPKVISFVSFKILTCIPNISQPFNFITWLLKSYLTLAGEVHWTTRRILKMGYVEICERPLTLGLRKPQKSSSQSCSWKQLIFWAMRVCGDGPDGLLSMELALQTSSAAYRAMCDTSRCSEHLTNGRMWLCMVVWNDQKNTYLPKYELN